MRIADPPVALRKHKVDLPDLALRPEKVLVAANVLSLSRGLAALVMIGLSLAGASAIAILAVASAMWVTDLLDGKVARRGQGRGALPRTDGAALDPLMDDVAFICGFLVLLGADAVPVWFVAGLLASRVLFALIRTTGLAHAQPFPQSEPVTKFNGVVLALGQLLLLAHVGFPGSFLGSDELSVAAIAVMTATTTYSIVYFAFLKHRRVLIRLLVP